VRLTSVALMQILGTVTPPTDDPLDITEIA
jgi:hypothetical protein